MLLRGIRREGSTVKCDGAAVVFLVRGLRRLVFWREPNEALFWSLGLYKTEFELFDADMLS